MWETPNELYYFGNDTSDGKVEPVTVLTFTIYGSQKMHNLFRSCLEGGFEWPQRWPNEQFTAYCDIACEEAIRFGCAKSQRMEIGPFAETMMSYIEEAESDDDAD